MRNYLIYALIVVGGLLMATRSAYTVINWGAIMEALDDGDGGGYSRGYGSGGYHK